MPHSITCGACKASFSIPDDVWEKRVQGQIATLKCRQCKAPIQVDGRTRKGSPDVGATNAGASVEQTAPTHVAAPTNVTKEASVVAAPASASREAPALASTKEEKPAAAKPQAKIDELAKKPEQKLGTPQIAKSTLDRPKTAGLQTNRSEQKQSEAKPAVSLKSNIENAKPPAEARAMASATKPHGLGTTAQSIDAGAHGRKASVGFGTPAGSATKPVAAGVAKSKALAPTARTASVKSAHGDSKPDEDLDELWVVSFSVDDDRELDTAQVLAHIAQGQLNADTIVWREGMADWLPISQVPQLSQALEPRNVPEAVSPKAAANLPQDDGEDETVIYRPGSKAAAFMESPMTSSSASKSVTGVGQFSPEKPFGIASRSPQPGAVRASSTDRTNPGQVAPVATAARSPARSAPGVGHAPEPSAGKGDTHETQAVAKGAGGPPPLRRQPSKPDDSPHQSQPKQPKPASSGDEQIVTSVREFASAAAPIRAAAPPPLPVAEKKELAKEIAAAKPAMFPPATQPAATVGTASPFAPVANPQSFPPTPSFAPRPSDIAALTKIRPKFPKWLPFAVLGGLVALVAAMAAMSWFRGESVESKESKPPADNTLPVSMAATKPGTSPTVSQTNTSAVDKKPASDGFANSFAQAVAKQRPTGKFDREAAEKALAPAFAKAAGCHNKGEPTGAANLTISIAPSGQVLSVTIAPPFTTTFTAECIRNALRDASTPPFQGSPGRLAHSITIH